MSLRVFYVSGFRGLTRIDLGPFFSEADARAAATAEHLTQYVIDEATREVK